MKKKIKQAVLLLALVSFLSISCQREYDLQLQQKKVDASSSNSSTPPFNLEVILRGEGTRFGLIKFRQDPGPEKIITLDTWVRDLEPNHRYLLQRAVDTNIDDDCTGTAWLTLGKGLTPQSILTDAHGTGREELWRNISAAPTGTVFDIHFRIADAQTMSVVLTSDCYQYVVR